MPAAAVIPAPIVYIKVVAVKKLVVEPRIGEIWSPRSSFPGGAEKRPLLPNLTFRHAGGARAFTRQGACVGYFTLKKFECSKHA